MKPVKPNFEWYSERSARAKITPRCPIASSELCPRYYASWWLLSDAGISTKITAEDKARLDRKWVPFNPSVVEEEPGIAHANGKLVSINEFCPEVAYEVFGFFASGLHRYADEIDRDLEHKKLAESGADADDPRWQWFSLRPRHFTECREYSIFSDVSTGKKPKRKSTHSRRNEVTQKVRWQVLARDSFTCQYCGIRPPEAVLEIDHKVSLKDGGSNELENLLTSCQECNRGKGAESSF